MNPAMSFLVCISSVLVTELGPTFFDPINCSLPGSTVDGIFRAMILEWVAISISRGSSWLRDRTWTSWTTGRFFTDWAMWKAQYKYCW